MSQQTDLIDINAQNVEETGFFCYMSKPKSEGYQRKLHWLQARFSGNGSVSVFQA
jgi:hypothetical protein